MPDDERATYVVESYARYVGSDAAVRVDVVEDAKAFCRERGLRMAPIDQQFRRGAKGLVLNIRLEFVCE